LTPVLRRWKLTELRGLSDEAETAREEILDYLERLDAAADQHRKAS
jgi:hypothetical protein